MGRIFAIDYLKFVMALLVAVGHSGLLQNHLDLPLFLLSGSIFRLIVPSFALVSGYFLFRIMQKGKFGWWMKRVIMLHVLWTMVYAPIWINFISRPRDLMGPFFWGYMQLWYLAGMIVAGFMVYGALLIGRWTRAGMAPLILGAVVCAVIGVALEYISTLGYRPIAVHHYRNGFFVIFPFMAMGYLIARALAKREQEGAAIGAWDLPQALRPKVLIPLFLVAVVLMLAESYFIAMKVGVSEVNSPEIPASAYLGAGLLFLIVLQLDLPRPMLDIGFLSGAIYFMHVLFQLAAGWAGVTNEWLILAAGVIGPSVLGLAYLRLMGILRTKPARTESRAGSGAG